MFAAMSQFRIDCVQMWLNTHSFTTSDRKDVLFSSTIMLSMEVEYPLCLSLPLRERLQHNNVVFILVMFTRCCCELLIF